MQWTVVRSLLPLLSALLAALAMAQPSGERTPSLEASAPSATAAVPEAVAAPEAVAVPEIAAAPAEIVPPALPAAEPARRDRRGRGRRGRDRRAAAPPPERDSVSVGRHNRGRLLHGSSIVTAEHLRLKHPDGDQNHGTDELVGMLRAAADHVWESAPGVRLTVGDLSRHSGGRLRPHRSHQNGRDVDVGFFIRDLDGGVVEPNRFFDFGPMGTTRSDPSWRFDDERNWLFVEHLLTQTDAPVQYMFVSRPLRRRLLAEGARRGVDPEILARAARVLYQPPVGGRHDDHFHVRVYCDAEDRPRCRDDGALHPWLRGSSALAEAATRGLTGLEDVIAAVSFFTAPPAEEVLEGDPEEAPPPRSRARSRRRRSARRR